MKLVLFCDYGLDDAAATTDALFHAAEDGYSSVDLVAVGGNVPAEIALKNARKLLAALDFPHPAVRIVDTSALPQPAEFLKVIHGGDGMGDLFEEKEVPADVVPFETWLGSLKGDFRLLSLGPMTLVPYALEKKPEKFIFMGGNIAEEPNFRGYEFNHGVNRAAFAACVKAAHVAITMDTCRHPLFNVQEKGVPEKNLLGRIVNCARERTFVSGEKGSYIWDDIAVKYLRHPDWFSLYEARDRDGNLLTVARYIHGEPFAQIMDR